MTDNQTEEPHDGSGRIERWWISTGEWRWDCTGLDTDHAKQLLTARRAESPLARYRLAPPGTDGYDSEGRRFQVAAPTEPEFITNVTRYNDRSAADAADITRYNDRSAAGAAGVNRA